MYRLDARKHRPIAILLITCAALMTGPLLLLSLRQTPLPLTAPTSPVSPLDTSKLPLHFEPNYGQTDPSVRYKAHSAGGDIYFTPSSVILALPSAPDGKESATVIARMSFIGANPSAIEGGALLPARVSYLIGDNPSKWHTNLPTYRDITYNNLYPGINLTYEGQGAQLKGTYTVSPAADPTQISWRYEGAQSVSVDRAGNLQILISARTITEQAPVVWQDIPSGPGAQLVPVDARYHLAQDGTVSLMLGSYDPRHTLIIDPTLTYSTYFGGFSPDRSSGIAVDPAGNMYITGRTNSVTSFPLANAFQPNYGGGSFDAFVTKFDPTGSTLIYSTFLGGLSEEEGLAIMADAAGNAYVTGSTRSSNFPVANAYQPTNAGGSDGFITKLSPTGSTLVYSTYLGGASSDVSRSIAIDSAGSAYVTGYTISSNFPTANAYEPTLRGLFDAFVSKLSPTGNSLVYSTYLGGSVGPIGAGNEEGYGIAVDDAARAYVTGGTSSSDFPTTNAYQPTLRGNGDAFVTRFSPAGSTVEYSTYLGGTAGEAGYSIAVDAAGSAYVSGITSSSDFPTVSPVQPAFAGILDAFVAKFNPDGSALSYSTYLGGTSDDAGRSIRVDGAGNAHLAGYTQSTNFPTFNPIQANNAGSWDVIVAKLDASGSALAYSTYLGGGSSDYGYAIALDTAGNAYITGETNSASFPTVNPYQPNNRGGGDGFIARISDVPAGSPTASTTATQLATSTRTSTPIATATSTTGSTATRTTTLMATMTMTRTSVATGTATGTNIPTGTGIATATRTATVAATGTSTAATTRTTVATSTATIAVTGTATGTSTPCSGRVTICHRTGNGGTHTITVSCNALPAHLQHGDTIGPCAAATPRARQTFSDVAPTDYFYDHVLDLRYAGAISGYADNTFRPYNPATRSQFVKITVLAFHIPLYTGSEQHFSDVPTDHPFYVYVETARRDNIVSGYADGTFRPFANITRGQLAKVAVESARMEDLSTGTPSFSDVPTSHTFYRYIETAFANGILSGYADGTFKPDADATRGQISKIIDLATHPQQR